MPNLAFREQMRYPDMWLCFGLGKEHQILCLVQFIPKTHYNLHFNSPSCYKTICGHYQNCVMPYVSELHFFCPCSTANTFQPKVNILYNHNAPEGLFTLAGIIIITITAQIIQHFYSNCFTLILKSLFLAED